MSTTIRFYFDFISNNAYLAWTQIYRLAERCVVSVEPVPVLFAGLLKAHGQLGPAEVGPKAKWMGRNVLRKAADLGVSLRAPASHPFNPLLALRACSVDLEPEPRRRLIDRLFSAIWAEARPVEAEAQVAELAGEAGLDGAAIVAAAITPKIKERLRQQTEDAIADSVFGVPSMRVGDEVFWGHDDLVYLERYLQADDPLPREQLAKWAAVRPSAWRPGVPPRRRR